MGSAIIVDPAMRATQARGAEIFFLIFKSNRASLSLLNTVPPNNVFTIDSSSVVSLALDLTCQGNYSEACHVDPEQLKRLSEDQHDAMLALIETADVDELLPQLRVGVAYGPAVSRAGDWFGSPVNLASRVTSAARPGSVLVAESAREQIADDDRYLFSFAGSRRLRGVISDVKLYRVRLAPISGGADLGGTGAAGA